MRFFRKLAKFMMLVAIIGVLIYFGIYLYIRLCPKVDINTENSVFLYAAV